MDDYFRAFEHRRPPAPLPYSATREALWQFLATVALVVGGWYIGWRWLHSLNPDAMWFAIPLVLAESAAYIGLILFVYNLWKDQPVEVPEAPAPPETAPVETAEAEAPAPEAMPPAPEGTPAAAISVDCIEPDPTYPDACAPPSPRNAEAARAPASGPAAVAEAAPHACRALRPLLFGQQRRDPALQRPRRSAHALWQAARRPRLRRAAGRAHLAACLAGPLPRARPAGALGPGFHLRPELPRHRPPQPLLFQLHRAFLGRWCRRGLFALRWQPARGVAPAPGVPAAGRGRRDVLHARHGAARPARGLRHAGLRCAANRQAARGSDRLRLTPMRRASRRPGTRISPMPPAIRSTTAYG